ncbi:TlpA family protein disulfide reductase [Candidatus Woesearchaeota archaeon]|nr:TlpA family protein disulfide reductase [Candidatus Woesearchaeota archaeon]
MLLIFIFAIFAIGCSQNNPQKTAQDTISNLRKFAPVSSEYPNKPAPLFTLTDDKGVQFTSEDLKGKIYVLQGFSPGCSSCAREIGNLNKVYNNFQDKNVEIISLDILSEDISGALDTKEQFNGGDWIWAVDFDDVAAKFGMRTLESTYIVDKEGIIRYKDEIISNPDTLIKEIEKLV